MDVTGVPLWTAWRDERRAAGVVTAPTVNDPSIVGRPATAAKVAGDPAAFESREMVTTAARTPKVYRNLIQAESRRMVLVGVPGCTES